MELRTSCPTSQLRRTPPISFITWRARAPGDGQKPQRTVPVAAGAGGQEKTQKHHDDQVDGDGVGSGNRSMDVAQQPSGFGDEAQRVGFSFGPEQLDPVRRQVGLYHFDLRVDHAHRRTRLFRKAGDPPGNCEGGDDAEDDSDESEPPDAGDRKQAAHRARAGVQEGRKQDAGEQEEQARHVVPGEGERQSNRQDDQQRCQQRNRRLLRNSCIHRVFRRGKSASSGHFLKSFERSPRACRSITFGPGRHNAHPLLQSFRCLSACDGARDGVN